MTAQEQMKRQIITLLDTLPAERLEEVTDFVAFLRTRHALHQPVYTPVALGGLWFGESADETDIAEIRQEIWGSFGEQEP
ncbi:MAG TPA: hypothetical protein PKC19_11320 [Roseiflexaceae bacterium]|nr:hypothetical protein [Roseiflexaceae bacterium]